MANTSKKCVGCRTEFSPKVWNQKYCQKKCAIRAYEKSTRRIAYRKQWVKSQKRKDYEQQWKEQNKEKLKTILQRYRIKSGRSKTIYNEGMTNECQQCHNLFAPHKFHAYQKYCMICRKKRMKQTSTAWAKEHPDKVKIIQKRFDLSEKRQKHRQADSYKKWRAEYNKAWQQRNPDKLVEYYKRYQSKFPERTLTSQRRYYKTWKGKISQRKHQSFLRALQRKGLDPRGRLDHNKIIDVIRNDGQKCPLCGSRYNEDLSNMELGHILPVSKFPVLAADTENVQPICKLCNRSMHDKLFTDYCVQKSYPIPERVFQYIAKQGALTNFFIT